MKHLIFLVFLLTATISFAQDIITTKSGEDILAKILEVGHTEIKYKKFDNQDGPVFVLLKSDVLMIRYENGTKDIINAAPKSNAVAPSNYHPDSYKVDDKLINAGKVEKYRRMKHTGATLTVIGGILFVVGVATLSNSSVNTYSNSGGPAQTTTTGNPEAGALAFLFGLAGLGTGIPLWAVGAHNEKKYSGLSFKFNMNQQGKGLTLAYRF